MIPALILYPDNEARVVVDDVFDLETGAYINDATVQATLYDSTDTEVTGPTWPLACTYVTDSDGRYEVTIPAITVGNMPAGSGYYLQVVVKEGATTRATINLDVEVRANRRS